MQLTIEQISDTEYRITCDGGLVQDIRTGEKYSEVICEKKQIKWFIGVPA